MTSFIGNNPEQIPLNGTLGNMAFQSKERVNITGGTLANVTITNPTVPALNNTVIANGTLSDTVEAVGTSTYNIASQYDVGTAPNQIPLNQYLGTMAFQDAAYLNVGGIATTGNVSIGTTTATARLTLAAGAAAASSGPLKFTSGTNLTTPEAGAVEYDGTVMTATSNTNFRRGTIPLTNYTSGAGTALGTNTEATNAVLLPAANDTITLSVGTYFVDLCYIVTRGPTSTTSATARLNIRGTGTAVGNFSGMSISAPTEGGASANFAFDAANITADNVVTAASTTAAGVYTIHVRGILKITTSGTVIPQYSLSANINAAGTISKVLYFSLQQLDTQSAAAFGPAGTGWA